MTVSGDHSMLRACCENECSMASTLCTHERTPCGRPTSRPSLFYCSIYNRPPTKWDWAMAGLWQVVRALLKETLSTTAHHPTDPIISSPDSWRAWHCALRHQWPDLQNILRQT